MQDKQQQRNKKKVIIFREGMTARELAELLDVTPAMLIKDLFSEGYSITINLPLDRELTEMVISKKGFKLVDEAKAEMNEIDEEEDTNLERRPPIVAIMGHVDHGKTTLLDYIRKSKVALNEPGGITQKIGAYQVNYKGRDITFIDTPGHAAFLEMRKRGAKATDIVILVVAGDDGVMPQTKEAVEHVKNSKVALIVALNKMDKPGVNKDRILSELSEIGVTTEQWGGTTPLIEISATKGTNIDVLLDTVLLTSDMDEKLVANPNRLAVATVIEAYLDKGKGPVASVIINKGTLKIGQYITAGTILGKVKSLNNEKSKSLNAATPSMPVQVCGLDSVPVVGDKLVAHLTQKDAEEYIVKRKESTASNPKRTSGINIESLLINKDKEKYLNIIIKTDVNGSIQPIKNVLESIKEDDWVIKVIKAEVGAITQNDVMFAKTSGAMLVGFNVRPTSDVKKSAESEGIAIKLHNIIYKLQEEIIAMLRGDKEIEKTEVVIGQLLVRDVIKIKDLGVVAGCVVQDGYITRDAKVTILRDGIVKYSGKLKSLKRFKDDAKEVKTGFECGLMVENYNDFKVDDILEASHMEVKNE